MSAVLYPLGLIAACRIRRFDRVIKDEFEAGNTTARRSWPASYYKRLIEVQHADLTLAEWRYLRSFYSQRGTYDSFYFRDNVNRGGNALVRFASEVPEQRGPVVYNAQVQLEEVAPVRQLPEFDEVATAAGNTPVLWYDALRETYVTHLGTVYQDSAVAAYDAAFQNYPAPWQNGSDLLLRFPTSSVQAYGFSPGGGRYAKTAVDLSPFASGAQPATIFLIAQQNVEVAKQVLFAIGAMGAGAAFGVALSATNHYEPWLGGSETWTNAKFINSPTGTQRSIAVTRPAGTSTSLYVNGALIGADNNGHSACPGPAVLGAAFDGTLACTNGNLAHILVFNAELTLAQIKALHNLFAYQWDLATV